MRFKPLAGLAALLLSACFLESEDKSAGVDDFPNAIYARVDGFLDEGKKAEGLETAPSDSLLIRQSFNGPAVKKASAVLQGAGSGGSLPAMDAMAKRASGPCPATFTWTERKPAIGTTVTVDTLILCVDSLFTDLIKDNEHVVRGKSVTRDTVSGRVETGEFSDGDGDGFLNPIPGGSAKAWLRFTVEDKGVAEKTATLVGDGPDDDFDTEKDNLIYEMSWSKTRGDDTLGSASYADADGDSVAIDNGKPSLVDVKWFAVGPTDDDPTALWSRIAMRTLVTYGMAKNPMVRFAVESESGNGRRSAAVILALDGKPDFAPGDTVEARFKVVGTASADSIDTAETVLKMKLGDFDDKTDDTTYAIRADFKKKSGEEKRAAFEFKSSKPVPKGKDPELGTLTMRVDYRDGTFLAVEGEITEKTVDVTATLRDGKKIHVVWDRAGKGISLKRLN